MKQNGRNVFRGEPFEEIDSFETDGGTALSVGDDVLVKPTYISRRLPAVVEKIYLDPIGFRGDGYEYADGTHKCRLKVAFRLGENDSHPHLEGKQVRVESFNLDFCVGSGAEIKRDRSNCNA